MSVSIFFSYSHEDEALRDKVAQRLSALKRSNVIQEWHDRLIPAGSEWKDEIDRNLDTADIILLLVSASFLSSEYCWSQELARAMARHEAGEARVIPVILRPCFWQNTPFAKLQMLPKDAKAVTLWSNEDEALTNVAEGIWTAVSQVIKRKQLETKVNSQKAEPKVATPQVPPPPASLPKQQLEDDLRSEKNIDYTPLRDFLKAGEWEEADQETLRVMCRAMGREEEGWFREEDIQQFSCQDLRTIDQLWRKYSDERFGFSVQKTIWQECGSPMKYKSAGENWERFSDIVGWRVNNHWIRYNKITFAPSALPGHLPARVWKSERNRYAIAIRLGYLFSRVEACEL
jgi:hypothetical protein